MPYPDWSNGVYVYNSGAYCTYVDSSKKVHKRCGIGQMCVEYHFPTFQFHTGNPNKCENDFDVSVGLCQYTCTLCDVNSKPVVDKATPLAFATPAQQIAYVISVVTL